MNANNETYYSDKIRAIDAKFEAQKIAFSPLTFQAARALIELGLLRKISDSGDEGISVLELSKAAKISEYGASVLCEIALCMGILKLAAPNPPADLQSAVQSASDADERFILGKIGYFLLEDELTKVNFNFANDICYKAAFSLADSVKSGRPEGLRVFGENWTTIYEALSSLPEREKKSWFDFDHFYSDAAFGEALPIVYSADRKPHKIRRLFDIGGNTAKWAIASCRYDRDLRVTIVDLPGQTAVALKNAADSGFADRISAVSGNILDDSTHLPAGADAVWMSQFLDCFSLKQITKIMTKIRVSVSADCDVFVMEPLWDMQKFSGESYALTATSLYFTCVANGNSKMYRSAELISAIERAGFELKTAHHNLGTNFYSILRFRKTAD